jgi:hypothetical protein
MDFQTKGHEDPIDLSTFDDAFQGAAAARTGLAEEPVPDGLYETLVEDVQLVRSSRSGNPMLVWRLRITGAEHTDRKLFKRRVITEKSLPFVREDLERCGVALDRFSDLPHRLYEMRSLPMRVVKKTNGEWTDIYFLRTEPQPELDDNLPF